MMRHDGRIFSPVYFTGFGLQEGTLLGYILLFEYRLDRSDSYERKTEGVHPGVLPLSDVCIFGLRG